MLDVNLPRASGSLFKKNEIRISFLRYWNCELNVENMLLLSYVFLSNNFFIALTTNKHQLECSMHKKCYRKSHVCIRKLIIIYAEIYPQIKAK